MRIYAALGIRKETIQKENWAELVASHEEFVANYHYQVHWAHRGRQSPAEVLGWVHGMQRDPAHLHRIFYTTRFGRTLDNLGYVRFRHWRIHGERGLAGRQAAIWLYGETLLIEFRDQPLAQYPVAYEENHRHFLAVQPRQLFETKYRSPQLFLWDLSNGDWLQVVRLPPMQALQTRVMEHLALALP